MTHIVILSLVIMGVVFHGEALRCYECENCEFVPQTLTTCGGEVTSTTGSTSDGGNTTGNGTAGTGSEATEATTTVAGGEAFEDSEIGPIEYFKDLKADPYAESETYVCVAYSEEVILNGDQNNVTTTSRKLCLTTSQLKDYCPTQANSLNSFRVHVCKTDGCNGSSRTSATSAGMPLIIAFVILTQFVALAPK